eukprot:10615_1
MKQLVNLMHTGLKFFWIERDAGLCHPDYIYNDKTNKPCFKIPDINNTEYKTINRQLPNEKKRFFVTSKSLRINTFCIADYVHIHLDLNHFKTRKDAHEWLIHRRSNIYVQQQAKQYKQYLQQQFHKLLMSRNSKKYIRKTYNLYIHIITELDAPQIWRRIKINGRMTLAQFDDTIKMCLGFGSFKNSEFRFNLKYMKNIKKPPNKYISKELRITNDKIWNHHDRMILRLTKDGTVTMNMNQILMGQIMGLFKVNFHKTKGKVPIDIFMQKYYKQYSRYYHAIMSSHLYQYTFDNNLRNLNFNYDLKNTFQWIYDLGNDWRCNVYLEEIDNDIVTKNKCMKYVTGSGIVPPESLGDFEDWKNMLLKCMGLYDKPINGTKTAKDFYDWQKRETSGIFLDTSYMELWMIKNNWNGNMYPEWMGNSFPLFKPYNLNITEFFLSEFREQSSVYMKQNKTGEMKRLRSTIKQNKFCQQCCSMIGKLKRCKKCQLVFYCSKRCQKLSWNKYHRLVCF